MTGGLSHITSNINIKDRIFKTLHVKDSYKSNYTASIYVYNQKLDSKLFTDLIFSV